jgi:NAD(P)H-quinone oxidoreductase subunit 6
MIVVVFFWFLSIIAVLGAGGILFYRHTLYSSLSFLLCGISLTGLYLLLNAPFLAAAQFVLIVYMTGMLIVMNLPAQEKSVRRHHALWAGLVSGLLFVALAYWGIAQGNMGELAIGSPPVWAVRSEHVSALGQELSTRYLIPFMLLGLLMFAGIVSSTYLIRQRYRPRTKEENK